MLARLAAGIFLLALAACGQPQQGNVPYPEMKVGKPYSIHGDMYYPGYDGAYDKIGVASWYGPGFHGKYTASGEVFDQNELTAAHPTLPMPSLVRVTNLENGRSVVVRVNDRGPFEKNRIIDLSKKAAQQIGMSGTAKVRVQYLGRETDEYIQGLRRQQPDLFARRDVDDDESRDQSSGERQVVQAAPVVSVDRDDLDPPVTMKSGVAAEQTPAPVLTPVAYVREEPDETGTPESAATAETREDDTGAAAKEPAPVAAASEEPVETAAPARKISVEVKTVSTKTKAYRALAPEAGGAKQEGKAEAAPKQQGETCYIQAGAYASAQNARALADKIRKLGVAVQVSAVEAEGKTLQRVRAGPLPGREAEDMLQKIVKLGVPGARIVRS